MIILRYLAREIYTATITIALITLLVFLVNQVLRFLSHVVAGKLLPGLLWQLILLQIPYLLIFVLPFAIFLGVVFAYGRLNADRELIILHAHGYSRRKLMGSTLIIATPLLITVILFSSWITPLVAEQKDRKMAEAAASALVDLLQPKRFIEDKSFGRTYYAENIAPNHTISDLFVFERGDADECADSWSVVTAKQAVFEFDESLKEQFLVLEDGRMYAKECSDSGQPQYQISSFAKYYLYMPRPSYYVVLDEESASMRELWQQRHHNIKAAAELNWRIALPIANILLIILAVWLHPIKPKVQRYTHLLPAIIIYAMYMNALFLMRDWIEGGKVSPTLGFWLVHGMLLSVIAIGSICRWLDFAWLTRFLPSKLRGSR